MRRTASLLALSLLCAAAARAQQPLLDPRRAALLHEALSGELAKEHVIAISRHHRIQGSRGYRDAAQYVLGQLRRTGFGEREAWIESFPSDGRVAYQTWQSPSGWDISSAELRMVEPFDERIAGYPEIAMSVMTYSNAGDVTAELVWVGTGTREADYAGKDVRGKFVLCTGYGGAVHRLAVLRYGAAGVVCFLNDDRAREYPDMLQYTGMWPRTDELSRVTFGFNLTNRQGTRLRDLLLAGRRVVLHGVVRGTGLEPFFMDVPVAVIPGSDSAAGELVFSAHLDHPKESANDNASGSGAILDIARTVRELIDAGRLPRPRRTLRFLWVPEWNGTMAYIDRHPELAGPALGGRVLANMNLDMVGEDLELLHSQLYISRSPASLPTAVNDVAANVAALVAATDIRTPRGSLSAMNWRMTPYTGGSDHMMFIDRRVPGLMLGHEPDYTHHTSEDTPDKVDPVELERSEMIAAGTMLYLADLTDAQGADLAYLVASEGAARLGEAARVARARMLAADSAGRAAAWYEAWNAATHAGRWEREAVATVRQFTDGPATRAAVDGGQARLTAQEQALVRALMDEARAAGIPVAATPAPPWRSDDRIPVRLTRGPLDFGLPASRLPAEAAAWYDSIPLGGDARFELVNFIDGTRSVTRIRDALSAEFGPVPQAVVARYLEDLVRIGVVRWR